jgi:mannose-6-phosphate isomerase-like protein (cupin superfamily)
MAKAHPKDMTPEDREAFHLDAESRMKIFKYEKPQFSDRPKKTTWLVNTPLVNFVIQTVKKGGENNVHYHTKSETTWFVLRGRARFTGQGGKVWAELGPDEGIFLPGGCRYAFQQVGDEELEILQSVAIEEPGNSERLNVEAHREWMVDSPHLVKY